MLNRPPTKNPRRSGVSRGSSSSSPLAKQFDEFFEMLGNDLHLEAVASPDKEKPVLTPKLGVNKTGANNEQQIMQQYGWYWEPLLHDLEFIEQMRDNISLLSGNYQKFVDLVMEGFHLECEDPNDNQEIADLLINDPTVDFAEVVRAAVLSLCTIANCYYMPIYVTDERGFRVRTFRPIKATAMRKLRDENLVVRGYVQLYHRPAEFLFGTPSTPTVHLAEDICCGYAYTDSWYAYGKPPLAALPFVSKMKLQMERDLVEMLHQHVPRIDITYTPDPQMNDDQVGEAITKAQKQVASLKPTDNYIHTPDFLFEYKGPQGKALDFAPALRYVGEQIYAVLPLLSGYLSSDLNINPMIATQTFRLTCSLANMIRSRVNVMFQPSLQRVADERDMGSIKCAFTDLDAETAETQARTNEYNANNAATNRDNGFVDQDTAAKHATQKTPGGPVKKAAKAKKIPEEVPAHAPGQQPGDPNSPGSPASRKPKPTTGPADKPPSKGGRSKTKDAAKGPKPKNRSAPTPDKRTKGRRHEDRSMDECMEDLESAFAEMT